MTVIRQGKAIILIIYEVHTIRVNLMSLKTAYLTNFELHTKRH